MSTKTKSANTAKQVSAQKKINELSKTIEGLKKECKAERETGLETFRILREKTKQVNRLTEELQKSKEWAALRNDQVGKLIDIMDNNSQTQANGVFVGQNIANGLAEVISQFKK